MVAVSYLVHYDTLLQNATQNTTTILFQNRTKCVSFFITKCDSFNTKFDSYNKMRQFYYKMQQLLQNATFVTKCVSTYPIYKSETMSYEGLFFSFFDTLAQF